MYEMYNIISEERLSSMRAGACSTCSTCSAIIDLFLNIYKNKLSYNSSRLFLTDFDVCFIVFLYFAPMSNSYL